MATLVRADAAAVTCSFATSGAMIHHSPTTAIAFDIDVEECMGSTYSVPKRVRRRLEQTVEIKSLEDIEAKLKEADVRRQQFHGWLANKAKPKRAKSDHSCSPISKELAERLQAKLNAAEQKRLELLTQEQMRLAKLHESRIAAKTEAQLRAEKEREELGCKVESRVQQAETNRLALVEAEKQRRAAANERIAQSILQRTNLEDKDRERIEALRTAIVQKIAAAEEKRACLLEAEKSRAQAIVLQARKVAKAVLQEREFEVMVKKEKLEARMLRAKRQRAEYLRQKGGCRGTCHNQGHKMHNHGDRLCRKLTRCWRQFRRSMRTTLSLAKEFAACDINQQSLTSLPFEQLADRITSPGALRSVKALLARIESRLRLSVTASSASASNDVDSLLKRLSPPKKPSTSGNPRMGRRGKPQQMGNAKNRDATTSPSTPTNKQLSGENNSLERYPARVFLCAYMIMGHPDAVFSSKGDRESALADAAAKLLPEFESLVSMVIDGPTAATSEKPFSTQLVSFDAAWHSYLCRFVAWKVKDAQLLEEDLIRVACKLEVSMLQKCKPDSSGLTHDTQAIRKQVMEDQKLLRDRVSHLTGKSGCHKMEEALVAVRTKFKENGDSYLSPFAYSSTQELCNATNLAAKKPPSDDDDSTPRSSKVARCLFGSPATSSSSATATATDMDVDSSIAMNPTASLPTSGLTNERIVNEMLQDANWKMPDYSDAGLPGKIQDQIQSTMEMAFWDSIEDNLLKETPDYVHVVSLVGEIRDDIEGIVPEAWKQEVRESLDLELLTQVLESGSNDFEYLRRLLDYALDIILRLGTPARDTESKAAHESLVEELIKEANEVVLKKNAFAKALVKGIRFVFERLQVLKHDISSIRLQYLARQISGSAGVVYLQRAFAERHKLQYPIPANIPSTQLTEKIPKSVTWFGSAKYGVEDEKREIEGALHNLRATQPVITSSNTCEGSLPPAFPMCTGGRVAVSGSLSNSNINSSNSSSNAKPKASSSSGTEETKISPVSWESTDAVIRLGILSMICSSDPIQEDVLPETLELNLLRMRSCQNEFQRIVVMATGLLVVRQEVMGKVRQVEVEKVMNELGKKMSEVLSRECGVREIGMMLGEKCEEVCGVKASGELMGCVLEKSLRGGDGVLGRVSKAVRESVRAVLMMGNEGEGNALAELAVKRIGGGSLVGDVVCLARKLERMSNCTVQVHGVWYRQSSCT